MRYYVLAAAALWAILFGQVYAQSPMLPGFPPGTFQNRAALDAASGCTDSDATAWAAAVVTAGGTVSGTQAGYVCTLITALKGHSLWTKADRIWLYATADNVPQQAQVDLVARVSHTLVGTPTYTQAQGYSGNGTDYINTNFIPPTHGVNYTQNAATLAVYIRNNRTSSANISEIGTADASANQSAIQPNTFGGGNNMSINDQFGTSFGTAVGTSQGFWTGVRTAGPSRLLYRNGSVLGSDSSGSTSIASLPAFFVLAYNNNGSAIQKSSDQIAIVWIGGGLDATDNANLSTDLNAYMTSLGTNVY